MKLAKLKPRLQTYSNTRLKVVKPLGVAERKRFYDSALWQQTRDAKIRRDPLCQGCAHEGYAEQARHVDHWLSLSTGGDQIADSNLVSLCVSHHSRKTRSEMDGKPVPFEIVPSKERTYGVAL